MIKLNWGFGITVTYIAFVAGMMLLVYLCSQHHVDLVSKDYYSQELAYQSQIDKIENSRALTKQPRISIQDGNDVIIVFPDIMISGTVKGTVTFFKPDDSKMDFMLPIKTNDENIQIISSTSKGNWLIKLDYTFNDKSYYQESEILIR